MTRWLAAVMIPAVVLSIAPAFAGESDKQKAPDFYIGPALKFDLENDRNELSFSFAGAGAGLVAPEFGLYDGKLLIGVRYMLLGRRADLEAPLYGGPTLFWYDDHIGGGLTVGRHLSRRVILEASYRATEDWQGQVDLSMGYGFDWPW